MASVISVASGKGGVGKSVLVGNLGLLLARQRRRVVLADLDIGGSDLHIMFGLLNPSATLTDFLTRRVDSLESIADPLGADPRLRLIAGTGETLATANMAYATKQRLIRHLRRIDADVLIIDIGAGTNYHALDFFLMADHHVAVATPDPTSVLDLYRFIKLAAIRRVLAYFLARDPMTETLAGRDFASVEEVLAAAGETDETGRGIVMNAMAGFRPLLILNRTSARSRINTLQLQKLLRHYIGGELDLLGEIPDDKAVESSVRTYLPVVDAAPASPASAALTAIAGRLLQRISAQTVPQGPAAARD
jgi:flagellar biosynthesis protein FlhG